MEESGMVFYVIRRILWLIPTLLAMALVTFLVMHATPGSPLEPEGGNNPLSPAEQKNLAAKYGLDRPLWEQFGLFIVNVLQGDFGYSYVYKTRSVADIIWQAFPVSLRLGAMALLLATVLGVALGILAAVHQNSFWDYLSVTTALIAVSIPNFVMAVFLILLFSFLIPLFPTGGWGGPRDWVLPTIALALAPMAVIARYTRSSVLEVIRSDFIRTARAKGLAESQVMLKHVLKTAFIPVLTLLGPLFAAVGTGSFFVESIFRIPGLGRFFVISMTGRDYPMIMAVVLCYGAFLAVMNLLVDILYGVLDPRIRVSTQG
jgi:peptide/nickel transport system permease protein